MLVIADEGIGLIVLQILYLVDGLSVQMRGAITTPEWSLGTPPLVGLSTDIGGKISGSS